MRRTLFMWQMAGFTFTGILGTLLHFLYEWTNENTVVGLFSAINESIWEHMKLLFVPTIIFAKIESRYIGKKYDNFWCAKLLGILAGLILIPVLYYTYTGVFGKMVDWFNILIFFIAAAINFLIETKIMKKGLGCFLSNNTSKLVLLLVAILFVVFTFIPPNIPLFQDPTKYL